MTQRSYYGNDQTIVTDHMRQYLVSVLKEILHEFNMRYQSSDNLTEFVLNTTGSDKLLNVRASTSQ